MKIINFMESSQTLFKHQTTTRWLAISLYLCAASISAIGMTHIYLLRTYNALQKERATLAAYTTKTMNLEHELQQLQAELAMHHDAQLFSEQIKAEGLQSASLIATIKTIADNNKITLSVLTYKNNTLELYIDSSTLDPLYAFIHETHIHTNIDLNIISLQVANNVVSAHLEKQVS